MQSTACETLRKAKIMWPDVVDAKFLQRYVDDGIITKAEAEDVMK